MRFGLLVAGALLFVPPQPTVVSVTVTSPTGSRGVGIVATSSRGALSLSGNGRQAARDTIRATTPAAFNLDVSKSEAIFAIVGDTGQIEVEVRGPNGSPQIRSASRKIIVQKRGTRLEVRGVR